MYRSRGLAALTPSLALKAHCAFNLKQAQRIEVHSHATLFLTAISSRSADLAHKVHWTLCLKPNHALKELEMRYAISSSVKALMQVDSRATHSHNNGLTIHRGTLQNIRRQSTHECRLEA